MASAAPELRDIPLELEGALPDLGRFQAEYRAGWRVMSHLVLGLAAQTLAFFICVLIARAFGAGLMSAAVVVGIEVGRTVHRSVRAWGVRVLVFEQCLVHLRAGNFRVFGWHEITSFQQQTPRPAWQKWFRGGAYWMKLRRADGAKLTIDDLVDQASELGARIQAKLVLLPHSCPAE
jgi:hypothetical protein